MKLNKLFPSTYVSPDEIKDQVPLTVTIRSVQMGDVFNTDENKKEQKPILYFHEGRKGMILNKTNATTIGKLYDDETDHWPGKRIILSVKPIKAFGEKRLSIVVLDQKPAAAEPTQGASPEQPAASTAPPADAVAALPSEQKAQFEQYYAECVALIEQFPAEHHTKLRATLQKQLTAGAALGFKAYLEKNLNKAAPATA